MDILATLYSIKFLSQPKGIPAQVPLHQTLLVQSIFNDITFPNPQIGDLQNLYVLLFHSL